MQAKLLLGHRRATLPTLRREVRAAALEAAAAVVGDNGGNFDIVLDELWESTRMPLPRQDVCTLVALASATGIPRIAHAVYNATTRSLRVLTVSVTAAAQAQFTARIGCVRAAAATLAEATHEQQQRQLIGASLAHRFDLLQWHATAATNRASTSLVAAINNHGLQYQQQARRQCQRLPWSSAMTGAAMLFSAAAAGSCLHAKHMRSVLAQVLAKRAGATLPERAPAPGYKNFYGRHYREGTKGERDDMLQMVTEAALPMVRWPGKFDDEDEEDDDDEEDEEEEEEEEEQDGGKRGFDVFVTSTKAPLAVEPELGKFLFNVS